MSTQQQDTREWPEPREPELVGMGQVCSCCVEIPLESDPIPIEVNGKTPVGTGSGP